MRILCSLGTSLLLAAAIGVHAQDNYPSKPIRIVNPSSATGSPALFTRILLKSLEPRFGQKFIIESMPGGRGIIGVTNLVRSAPDGYSIMISTSNYLSGAKALLKDYPYDPINDVAGIIISYNSSSILAARAEEKGQSLGQIIEKMRRDPDRWAVGGTSSTAVIINSMMVNAARTRHVYVSYTGNSQQFSDLLGGRTGLIFQAPSLVMAQIQNGQFWPVAVSGLKRLKKLPGTGTMQETLPGVSLEYWSGYFAPARTPRPIINTLHEAFAEALKQPEAIDYMEQAGTIVAMPPDKIHDFMVRDEAYWLRVAREAGVQPE